MKNLCAKTDDNKPFARWFCLVTSPAVGERGEMGDCYVKDIKSRAIRVDHNEPGVREL